MMTSTEGNIQALSRALLSEARAEAEKVLADAKDRAEAIRARGQEQIEREQQQILEQAGRQAAHVRSQCLAAAQSQARKLQLERREKTLNEVFAAARRQMSAVQQRDDYDQLVREWVREAVAYLASQEARVSADARTHDILAGEVLDELSKELGVQLHLQEPLPQGVGVIAETPDGHLRYDNTLEARLARRQDQLRGPVYRLLMGESL